MAYIPCCKPTKKVMILMRGWPGSGKSTVARNLYLQLLHFVPSEEHMVVSVECFSTDDFFYVDGNYKFDKSLIGKAHQWNQINVFHWMRSGNGHVIVDNTNIKYWEMEPYIEMAKEFGYEVYQYCCRGEFKNSHGVPDDVVERMKRNFEVVDDIPHWVNQELPE